MKHEADDLQDEWRSVRPQQCMSVLVYECLTVLLYDGMTGVELYSCSIALVYNYLLFCIRVFSCSTRFV